MTDKEIKCPCGYREYMEEHQCKQTDCNKCCPLALQETINSQQAEIERLKAEARAVDKYLQELDRPLIEIRAEAIKEFAERLKMNISLFGFSRQMTAATHIDNLVKEMVGNNDV